MPTNQGIFWIGTLAFHTYTPWPDPGLRWVRGQLERAESGFLHWQILIALPKKGTLSTCKGIFGREGHWELTKSKAASDYVWKDATSVIGTRFEFGSKPISINSKPDWDSIWELAKTGTVTGIPASIRIRSYGALRRISADYAEPIGMERTCYVFWGRTGTGKSRRAWAEAGLSAYPKDPRTKVS